MKLQNVLFPSTNTCTDEEMFFRREGGVDFSWCNDHILMKAGSRVHFDTYFNGFSAEKWFKYTKIKKVYLTLKVCGKVRVTLIRKEKIGDRILMEFTGEYLCKTEKDKPEYFTFPFDTSSVSGMYCFSIASIDYQSKFYDAYYETDISQKSVNKVKLAIDICTYKRERFIENNLEILNSRFLENKDSELYNGLEVFISDNAHTLDSEKLSSDKVHIVENKNVGGAGGFTRGMIEIKKAKEKSGITHVLVMDDDILIEPEAIFRTYTMLSCTKDEYSDAFVGGAMLRLDNRYMQTESGALWNGGEIVSLKGGLDLRTLDACLFNEFEERAQFNAWWYCAFPVDVVKDDNLPMPIFIRGDDVEYGLRNMKHLILMNGICVWHEPFENKYSSFLYYYILRNRLIDNSLHNMVIPKSQFIDLLTRQVNDELRIYRYKNAELLIRGVEDFFKGVEWLVKQDGEKLHQDIMKNGYKLQYLEDLEDKVNFLYPLYENSLRAVPAIGRKQRIINKFTVNGTYLKPLTDYNIVPTVGPCQSSFYRVKTVLNYDYASRKGFVTKRDPEKCKELKKRLNSLCSKVNSEYESAVEKFAADAKKLTNINFWNKYLGI